MAMDRHPGSGSLDHDLLWRQFVPCIDGLRALSEQLLLLSPNAICQRVERSMAHQKAILERLDRCAATISEDSPPGEQVKALRDAKASCCRSSWDASRAGVARDEGRGNRRTGRNWWTNDESANAGP